MSDILIKIYRGNLVENIYRGDIAIVDKAGNHTLSVGDNEKITYWRSSAKPIQVIPVIYSGAADRYKLTDKEIAIMALSHNSEEKHIKLVYGHYPKSTQSTYISKIVQITSNNTNLQG